MSQFYDSWFVSHELWLIIYESQAYIVSLFSDVVQQLWNKFRIGTTLFKFFYFFRIEIWISFYLVYSFIYETCDLYRLSSYIQSWSDPVPPDGPDSGPVDSKTKPKPLRIA